ncbi:hypothetical protein [Methanopyrus sp.]
MSDGVNGVSTWAIGIIRLKTSSLGTSEVPPTQERSEPNVVTPLRRGDEKPNYDDVRVVQKI